jgi:hypothetical protein
MSALPPKTDAGDFQLKQRRLPISAQPRALKFRKSRSKLVALEPDLIVTQNTLPTAAMRLASTPAPRARRASLGARFRADAHLRNGVRDRAPCCTVVRHATRARTRFLRGEDAAPKRNSHHKHFRACSFRRRSLSRFHLDQFPLSRCAEPERASPTD